MKKVFLSLAVIATLTVVSCKQADANADASEMVDSTAMEATEAIDSTAAQATEAIDSTAAAATTTTEAAAPVAAPAK
ncbi:hypothetical protein [Flavobacterium sp.]